MKARAHSSLSLGVFVIDTIVTFFSNVDINLIKEIEYLKNINEAGVQKSV